MSLAHPRGRPFVRFWATDRTNQRENGPSAVTGTTRPGNFVTVRQMPLTTGRPPLTAVPRPPLPPFHPRLPSQPRVLDSLPASALGADASVLVPPSLQPNAFLSPYRSIVPDAQPTLSHASAADLYLEAHDVMRNVHAAIAEVCAERSADPLARVAQRLGERSVEPMLERLQRLEAANDALMQERSSLLARVVAITDSEQRLATLEAENAALRGREGALATEVEAANGAIQQWEQSAAAMQQELSRHRAFVLELSAKSTADETLMAAMAQDADAARARLEQLDALEQQRAALAAGADGASGKRVLVL